MAKKGRRALGWGEQVKRLEAAYTASGRTQKQLAESLGVHPSTVRRWKQRDDRPATMAGADLKRFRDRQNYWEVRRPVRLIEQGVLPPTLPPGLPPGPASGSLIDRPVFAFDFRCEDWPRVLAAIADGRRLVFELVVVDVEDFNRFAETVTIDTDGLSPSDVNRQFWRAARTLTRQFGSPDRGISIELNSVFAR